MALRKIPLFFLALVQLCSCTEREEFLPPELPGQHITLELADGNSIRYAMLPTAENLSILTYRFDDAPSPAEINLARAGRRLTESIQLSGALPLRRSDFDTAGFLREEAMQFPREAELDVVRAPNLNYCDWTATVRFESWSAEGILRGSFGNDTDSSCRVFGQEIVGGSFAVYVTAIRQN